MLFLLFPQTLTQGVIHNMNDSSGESLIQIKNLTAAVRLNNGDTLVTVNNASIELKRGNSYAIVGKSGSGKTSLISIIGLLNRSYKGEYLYDGVSVSALTDRELSMLRANNRICFSKLFLNQAFKSLGKYRTSVALCKKEYG